MVAIGRGCRSITERTLRPVAVPVPAGGRLTRIRACEPPTADRRPEANQPEGEPTVAEMFYDDDADLSLIQGRTWPCSATAARATRTRCRCATPASTCASACPRARRAAPRPRPRGCACSRRPRPCEEADLIVILAPDHVQRKLYAEAVEPNLVDGDALFFGHGFNIRFGYITPPEGVDVSWSRRRARATWSAASTPTAAASRCSSPSRRTPPARPGTSRCPTPRRIGGLRAGGIKTTFTEETETDLFGEQAVLCGGASRAGACTASRCSPRPATSPRSPTSSACTSSS